MGVKRFVHFAWRNILTALNDQFLQTACHKHISLFVLMPEVTRAQPTIGREARACLIRVLEILFHDIRTANGNLALFIVARFREI